ncbi:hypothetical protein V6Z11_D02G109900 [Gossypium hirsutum]
MKSAFGLLITNFLHFFFSLVLFYFLPFFHFFQGLEGELPRYNNLFLVSHFLPPVIVACGAHWRRLAPDLAAAEEGSSCGG